MFEAESVPQPGFTHSRDVDVDGAQPAMGEGRVQTAAAPNHAGRDALGVGLVGLGLLCGVTLAVPAEGIVASPLREAMGLALGTAAGVLPLGLLLAGGLLLARGLWPAMALPWARLLGVSLIGLALLPSEHLIGLGPEGGLARAEAHAGSGLVGYWLSSTLIALFGGPATAVVLAMLLSIGALLAFDTSVAQVVAAGQRLRPRTWRGVSSTTR